MEEKRLDKSNVSSLHHDQRDVGFDLGKEKFMRKRTRVLNMRTGFLCYRNGFTSIGEIERRDPSVIRIDRRSIFGNPFKLSSSMSREESMIRYQAYFDKRIAEDRDFAERVKALVGFKLGCWCKPKACHGDIIAAWLNEQEV